MLHPQLPQDCGRTRFNKARHRIISGEDAQLGQFPFIVRIGTRYLIKSKLFHKFSCGGSLISKFYIVTAAHCDGGVDLVRIGENDVSTDKDCDGFGNCAPPVQDIPIKRFIFENFIEDTLTNDYALIELKTPVKFNEYVQPVCLPPANIDHASSRGKMVFLAGFGRIRMQPAKYANKLQYIRAPIVNNRICSRIYHKYTKRLTNKQWCIGYSKGKDTCAGDSGGPATMSMNLDGERREYLIGVISYGLPSCGTSPAVYTDVSRYVNWTIRTLDFLGN
ncbi:hypothetical protein NQ315_009696 [Exocentrus adspersus]|uniref:Peptidase S1 domain-containing protein n=1 Tax=Exocentrus adspersus TaxID=1586481 RepID=A0AAV8WH27_9CUCU|nr:hypothetical protein NQ315_009696 [Exocentrus adspersus]